MQTILKFLRVTNGGDFGPETDPVNAKSGFTASTFTSPDDSELSFDAAFTLLAGHTGAVSNKKQKLILPRLTVPSDSFRTAVLSIAPVEVVAGASETETYLQRVVSSSVSELMNYNNGQLADLPQIILSGVTLGPDDDLTLGGSVSANQDGMSLYEFSSSIARNNAIASGVDADTTTPVTTTNGTDRSTDVDNLGSWPVKVELQPVLGDFDKFVIPSGVTPPSSGFLSVSTGKSFDFEDFVDEDGTLLLPFLVKPEEISIVEQVTLTVVKFLAGSRVPEGTRVYLDEFEQGTRVLSSGSGVYSLATYAGDAFPHYEIPLSRGSTVECPLTLFASCSVPPETKVDVGATTTGVNSEGDTESLVLQKVAVEPGFTVQPGVEMTSVVLKHKRFVVPKDSTTSFFQSAIEAMRTEEPLNLEQVIYPPGVETESTITLEEDLELPVAIVLTKKSLVRSGSVIASGASSMTGALVDSAIQIDAGSVVTNDVDIKTPFIIAAGSIPLEPGAVLHGPFEFPQRTKFYEGNYLPDHLKVTLQMAVTFAAGMILPAHTVLGSMFNLFGNLGFAKNGIIPQLATLFGRFTFPVGTSFEQGTVMGAAMPVPTGTRFTAGEKLPAGMSFKHDTALPLITDVMSQAQVGGSSSLRKTSDGQYLILKPGTALIAGFEFAVGSVLSNTDSTTNTLADATGGSDTLTVTLPAGSFTNDRSIKAPSALDFDLVAGTATEELVVLLTDVVLDRDLFIPADQLQEDLLKYISPNEPLVLAKELVLSSPYVVRGNNSVMWPANIPTHSTFVLSSPFTFTAPTDGLQLTKKIVLNVATTDDFVYGVMASDAHIRMPAAGVKTETPFELAVDQPVAGTGTNATKSTVDLPAGTKLKLTGTNSFITLVQAMKVSGDFTVTGEFLETSRIFLPNGIKILLGQQIPGDMTIPERTPLPSSITVGMRVKLAADCVLTDDDDYTVPQYSLLKAGTVINLGSSFPDGMEFTSPVTLGPISSLTSDNIFYFLEETKLGTDILLPYLMNNGQISTLKVDDRDSQKRLREAIEKLQALESLVASRS